MRLASNLLSLLFYRLKFEFKWSSIDGCWK